jgi:hypothetical protein
MGLLYRHENRSRDLKDQIMPIAQATAVDAEERRFARIDVDIAAGLRSASGRRASIIVRNVSVDGFMAEGAQNCVPGLPATFVLFDGRSFAARIVWKRDGHIGCAFETPLDAATLASIA